MEKYTSINSFSINRNVLFQGIIISLKERMEYPGNTIALLFVMTLNFSIYMFMFTITSNLFLENLNWTLKEFSLFILFSYFCNRFFYVFDARFLFRRLLLGELNVSLTKPAKPFILENTRMMNGQDLIVLPFIGIPALIIFLSGEYQISLILLFILILFMCWYNFILSQCIGSFGFISKMLPWTLHRIDKELLGTTRVFTPKVFETSLLKNFVYILPSTLMGFGLIEFLLGKTYIYEYFLYAIIFSIILIGITILNWSGGLKKYEAFS